MQGMWYSYNRLSRVVDCAVFAAVPGVKAWFVAVRSDRSSDSAGLSEGLGKMSERIRSNGDREKFVQGSRKVLRSKTS